MSRGRFTATLDRIEDECAVLLAGDGEQVSITMPERFLPQGVRVGEHLIVEIKREIGDTEEEAKRIIESLGRLQPGGNTGVRD
jgi:hypothetical protein